MNCAPFFAVPLAAMHGCASPAEPPAASSDVVLSPAPASGSSSGPGGTPAASAPQAPAVLSAPACCKDFEELKANDGKRVSFEGVYKTTAIMKRGGDDEADKKARTVQIVGAGTSVMLEIYYSAKGKRDLEEIDKLRGKKVRVVGTLRARTPDQMHGDIPMQTMTDPSIVDIESIEPL